MKNKLVQLLAGLFALLCVISIGLTNIADAQSPDLQPSENTQIPMSIQTELTQPVNAIQSPTADGDLDLTFDGDGIVVTSFGTQNDVAKSVAIQSDGKIVAIATTTANSSNSDFALVRYNTNGSFDTTFGTGGGVVTSINASDVAESIAIQSDGKIVAAGWTVINNFAYFAVVRYNVNGSLDTTFDTDGIVTTAIGPRDDIAKSVAIQSDGKIVVTGYTIDTSNRSKIAVVRYNTNGSLDSTFGTGGIVISFFGTTNDYAEDVAIQSNGKIVVVGKYNTSVQSNFY